MCILDVKIHLCLNMHVPYLFSIFVAAPECSKLLREKYWREHGGCLEGEREIKQSEQTTWRSKGLEMAASHSTSPPKQNQLMLTGYYMIKYVYI